MINSINNFIPTTTIFNSTNNNNQAKTTSFSELLKENLDSINKKQIESDEITEKFINGDEDVDIHEVMIAAEEAKLSLELAVQVRNKIIEAIQEVSRMQI